MKYSTKNSEPLVVDEGFITLCGSEAVPAHLIAGRQYIPYGYCDRHFVTDPNTFDNVWRKMMRLSRLFSGLTMICLMVFAPVPVTAHFGMVIPSDTMVMQEDSRTIDVTLSFSHPMERVGMELEKPKVFAVSANGKQQDLLGQLQPVKVMDHKAWQVDYAIKRPGVYVFHMEPQPYWEPAEDCFIVHLTKTVVAAFGDDEGWDAELGLKTEIVPLSKPYGLYGGNVFQGIVKMDGQPIPYAEVEVEYYNQDGNAQAPTDYMVTQTIKADGNGVFTYATPASGWWGFAALNTADDTIKHDGEDKGVELGAVIWVYFHDWK